jgi:biopolymer transport protein ExbB
LFVVLPAARKTANLAAVGFIWPENHHDLLCRMPYNARYLRLGGACVFTIVKDAGWPIWPLLFASIIAVALIIERFFSLRRSRIVPSGLLQRVLGEVGHGSVTEQMVLALEAHSPLGRVLAAGLRNRNASRMVMKEAIEETGRAVTHQLERFLTTLGTIASIAPLMGLFGTVVGMIEMFGAQGVNSSDPIALAHGISTALYNTGFGILIAIPSMIFWRHFRALVSSFVIDMEQQAIRLVEVLHGERNN